MSKDLSEMVGDRRFDRMDEDANNRQMTRRDFGSDPQNILLVSVPKTGESGMRESEIKYFAETRESHGSKCHRVECFTPSEVIAAANSGVKKTDGSIVYFDEVYILAHGNIDGSLHFPQESKGVAPTDVSSKILLRGDHTGYTKVPWIHCFNHVTSADHNVAVQNYQFRVSHEHTTSDGALNEVTYNVPRELVDGKLGCVHSGLNPEVLTIGNVKTWITLALLADKLKQAIRSLTGRSLNNQEQAQFDELKKKHSNVSGQIAALRAAAVRQ